MFIVIAAMALWSGVVALEWDNLESNPVDTDTVCVQCTDAPNMSDRNRGDE